MRKDNKRFSHRAWSPLAIECYNRGCQCSGCYYHSYFSDPRQKCQMKEAVRSLVAVYGKPRLSKKEQQQFVSQQFITKVQRGKSLGKKFKFRGVKILLRVMIPVLNLIPQIFEASPFIGRFKTKFFQILKTKKRVKNFQF